MKSNGTTDLRHLRHAPCHEGHGSRFLARRDGPFLMVDLWWICMANHQDLWWIYGDFYGESLSSGIDLGFINSTISGAFFWDHVEMIFFYSG